MPNCTCFEPSTSKHRCEVCGDKYTIRNVSGNDEPLKDRNTARLEPKDRKTARLEPKEFVVPEIFRKFVLLYRKTENYSEGKPQ